MQEFSQLLEVFETCSWVPQARSKESRSARGQRSRFWRLLLCACHLHHALIQARDLINFVERTFNGPSDGGLLVGVLDVILQMVEGIGNEVISYGCVLCPRIA